MTSINNVKISGGGIQNTVYKTNKIELLRFVFSLMVVFSHAQGFLQGEKPFFKYGSLAVEFFFILSGFLMMNSIEKRSSVEPSVQNLGEETKKFIFKKAKGVYPEALLAYIIGFVVIAYSNSLTIVEMIKKFMLNVYEVLFVNFFGLGAGEINSATWYISSMLLCMAILYPLIRKWPDLMLNIVIPFTMLVAFGYLFRNYSSPRTPYLWLGFIYKGNIRAWANLCAGILSYFVCKRIKKISFNRLSRVLLTGVECGIYLFFIWYMYDQKASDFDYFISFMLVLAIALTFSGKCLDTTWYNNGLVVFLGKFSLPMFLSHYFYSRKNCFIFNNCQSDEERMVAYLLASFITALFVMGVSALLRKYKPQMTRLLERCFLSK